MELLSWAEIFTKILWQFVPVWVAMAVIMSVSVVYKRRLGLYGRLYDSLVGIIGFSIVLFWVLTALLADMIITMDPLQQVSGMKNKVPGTPVRGMEDAWYLLGGDNLARDIFSRMVMGARHVLSIARRQPLLRLWSGLPLACRRGILAADWIPTCLFWPIWFWPFR